MTEIVTLDKNARLKYSCSPPKKKKKKGLV